MFVRGADLTSTSYVYSSLVQDDSGRVVGSAAVDTPVPDLGAGDVQVADHIPLRCDHLADAVATALENGVIVQGPGDRGQGSSLHVAHEGHWLCRAHYFLTKGRDDFGSSIYRETKQERKWHTQDKLLPSSLFIAWERDEWLVSTFSKGPALQDSVDPWGFTIYSHLSNFRHCSQGTVQNKKKGVGQDALNLLHFISLHLAS